MPKGEAYYVTDRSFELLRKFLHLTDSEIQKIPENGSVLEVGSGVYRNFASGLSMERPDLKIFSVDPTLAISKEEFVSVVRRNDEGKIRSIYYTNKLVDKNAEYLMTGIVENNQKILKERLGEGQVNDVASLAPNLPFKNETFDLIVDSFGPGFYLHSNGRQEFEKYLLSIFNLLRPGGEARIFPVLNTVDIPFSTQEELKNKSRAYYQNILNKLDLEIEVSFEEIEPEENSLNSNLLMILRKK